MHIWASVNYCDYKYSTKSDSLLKWSYCTHDKVKVKKQSSDLKVTSFCTENRTLTGFYVKSYLNLGLILENKKNYRTVTWIFVTNWSTRILC